MSVPHLLFEQDGASGRQDRRLLIIAPAFPPSVGAGGVRLEKIAQHAAWRGWQVDAITGPFDSPDHRDDSRLQALPPGVRVWLAPMPEARTPKWITASYRGIRSLLSRRRVEGGNAPSTPSPTQLDRDRAGLTHQLRVRRHFAKWRRWTEAVVRLGMQLSREHRPSIVFSSGPPHEAHEAARLLSRMLAVPHVADFRDPWVLPDALIGASYGGPLWQRLTAKHEAQLCQDARLVVLNTRAAMDTLRDRYPALARKFITVMNGADPELKAMTAEMDPRFLVVHAGTLYGGRDPRPLFRGIRRFLTLEPAAAGDLCVLFIGDASYEGTPLTDIAAAEGLSNVFETRAFVPREDALTASRQAAVNVVLQQDHVHSIQSKVYDYMQFPAGLLALCRSGDATRALLDGTSASVIDPSDEAGIARYFSERYRDWRSGNRPIPVNADGRFDRTVQIELLLDAFDAVVTDSTPLMTSSARPS